MFIEAVRIQGFKSLADVELADLSAINVFHGLNDTGKSNLLEALDLFYQLLPLALQTENATTYFPRAELAPYHVDRIFRLEKGKRAAKIEWQIRLCPGVWQATVALTLVLRKTDRNDPSELRDDLALELAWPEGRPDEEDLAALAASEAGFNLLPAARWLHAEATNGAAAISTAPRRARRSPITVDTLKQALFSAAWNLNLERRARYRKIAELLQAHFGLAGLETAQDAGEYVVGFQRLGEILRLEDVGSGVQQLVLLLSLMLLNPARSVGIEEPEMNLSPKDWQGKLMAIFRELVDSGTLDQIFITSHSPEFEMEPGFWDVTYEDGATRVTRSTALEKYFPQPIAETVGEELGPHLNSLGQIRLPERVVADLGLQRRDPVFFFKTPEGHWQLRTRAELLALMETAEAEDVDDSAG